MPPSISACIQLAHTNAFDDLVPFLINITFQSDWERETLFPSLDWVYKRAGIVVFYRSSLRVHVPCTKLFSNAMMNCTVHVREYIWSPACLIFIYPFILFSLLILFHFLFGLFLFFFFSFSFFLGYGTCLCYLLFSQKAHYTHFLLFPFSYIQVLPVPLWL
ncbi:hypothetical protein ASPWEDRAFT_350549 [Aspergillus wentii DTO 134E9]|uniref:Uncharacterized protein n=1 Tax=Aspergillus wentii DTO 134E9 TaxID=1073089 RepID=A0A1L9RVM1_ASPWE|nr:uncharacterized protein ASPWEDRAFT_350549 [Aspergillus wentii DTO 134E9]OJJ39001.1 hypothetical protein ASPWEDRAFT_350549 [Aspergillus wentii DTO 134E9]